VKGQTQIYKKPVSILKNGLKRPHTRDLPYSEAQMAKIS